jgi:hypothetical protein
VTAHEAIPGRLVLLLYSPTLFCEPCSIPDILHSPLISTRKIMRISSLPAILLVEKGRHFAYDLKCRAAFDTYAVHRRMALYVRATKHSSSCQRSRMKLILSCYTLLVVGDRGSSPRSAFIDRFSNLLCCDQSAPSLGYMKNFAVSRGFWNHLYRRREQAVQVPGVPEAT